MKAVRLDQLVSSVTDKLPAAPLKGQVIRAIREAAKRFCFDTELWKEPLTAMDLVANQLTYTLATDWQAEIRRIFKVNIKTASQVSSGDLGTEHDTSPDTYTPATSEYRFASSPSGVSVTSGLVFTVVLVPNLQTDELPEWIIGLYGDAFVYGAVADLCMHKGAGPMFDPGTAQLYNRKYANVKSNAMAEAFRGNMNSATTVQPLYNLAGSLSTGGYRIGG